MRSQIKEARTSCRAGTDQTEKLATNTGKSKTGGNLDSRKSLAMFDMEEFFRCVLGRVN